MGPTARNIGSNGNIKKRLRNVQTGDGVIDFLRVEEEWNVKDNSCERDTREGRETRSDSQFCFRVDKVEEKWKSLGKSNPQPVNVKVVKPTEATPESFKEYGQVIEASPDGEEFGPKDAQLNLTLGIPRFYIMKLEKKRSKRGHFYVPPAVDKVQVFRISGSKFIKLNVGTWHAGPLFKPQTMDFYNLELSNTNVVDHTTHNFKQQDGIVFVIDD
ncbi:UREIDOGLYCOLATE HYDROLASE [Salix viminalis]|uniref:UREIDOGLYCOLATE HYDROLASE n=1 Tax=Salix viminalis TaxID=40686 RepID=A0A9Q0Z3Y8_SALVM|nr:UREIDOGLYCOLATE HYDROLASE [Salix viminalis]